MKFGKRKAAALLSLAVLGTLGASGSANASTGVDGFPILHGSTSQFAHTCTVIGSDTDNHQAVVCVDIQALPGSSKGEYTAVGEVEAYCQTGSGSAATVTKCDTVDLNGIFANGAGGEVGTGSWSCGLSTTAACSSGRNVVLTTKFYTYTSTTGCDLNPNSYYATWMIAQGEPLTMIKLPTSHKATYLGAGNANDGTGESTGHYYICW